FALSSCSRSLLETSAQEWSERFVRLGLQDRQVGPARTSRRRRECTDTGASASNSSSEGSSSSSGGDTEDGDDDQEASLDAPLASIQGTLAEISISPATPPLSLSASRHGGRTD
ncbi:hypothetical protein Agub_g1009, partial [Astrephomene gubernaculifera]